MQRIHLEELEDKPWFPGLLRDGITDLLQHEIELFRVYDPILPLLRTALDACGTRSMVDLCSGGGGPLVALERRFNEAGDPINITMTDRYPNRRAFERVRGRSGGRIAFATESVNAARVPAELRGVRSMFTAVHHFDPDAVRQVLRDACEARTGIALFDFCERSPGAALAMLPMPLLAMALSPTVRPFGIAKLLLSLALPIIPIVMGIDGVLSQLRAHTADELRSMAESIGATDYIWDARETKHPFLPLRITSLIGYPSPGLARPTVNRPRPCRHPAPPSQALAS